MRKTIEFTKTEIQKIEDYQKRNQLKNFSSTIKNIIHNINDCSCKSMDDEKFALLADAFLKLDSKIDIILMHMAPKSAGEVKYK